MNQIEIKLATVEERDWAARLIVSSEPWSKANVQLETARQVCHHPAFLLYIAHVEGKSSGAMVIDLCGVAGSPYIKWLVVAPDQRGHGIGAALIQFAETLARQHAKHLFLCVSSFNSRARALYEKLGFKQVGEIPDYFIAGTSEILMHKRIA